MSERYLMPVAGGLWALSREVHGRWLSLVQDSYLDHPDDATDAMRACGIEITSKTIDEFFPYRTGWGRCPTLEFLEIFSTLGKAIKKEYGV